MRFYIKRLFATVVAVVFIACTAAWSQPSEILVFDSRGRDLYHVDVFTGDRTLVSGSRWDRAEQLLVDPSGNALVIDAMAGILDRVGPEGIDTVAGPPSAEGLWGAEASVMLDDTRAMVVGYPEGTISVIDLVSGERSIVSSPTLGNGPPTRNISALAVQDPTHGLVTLANQFRSLTEPWGDGLYSIDLSTGDWTPLALAEPVSEETELIDFVNPCEIIPAAGGQVMLLESSPPGLTFVNTGGGLTLNVSLITDGEGEPLVYPVSGIERDAQNLWVLDHVLSGIYSVNIITGERTLLSREGERGTGPSLDSPWDMTLAPGGDALWVLTGLPSQQLIAVDMDTGNRRVIFESNVGAGPLLEVGPRDILPWESGKVLVLANGGFDLLEIDLATGDRSLLSIMSFPLEHIAPASSSEVWGVRDISLLRIDPRTSSEELVARLDNSIYDAFLLDVIALSESHVVVSTRDSGNDPALVEIDPTAATPEFTVLYSDPLSQQHVFNHIAAVDADTFVLVEGIDNSSGLTQSNTTWRFQRGSTELLPVSTSTFGGGAPLPQPRHLSVDETDDLWTVNAFGPPSLVRVELLSGLRTEISGANRGSGPMWQTATSFLPASEPLPPIPLNRLLSHILGEDILEGEAKEMVDGDESGHLDAADVVHIVGP